MTSAASPRLSLVLPLRASSRQAENALASLSAPHQVGAEHAEVLLVEGESDDLLGEERARARCERVRYFPVAGGGGFRSRALAVGFRESRAEIVGLFMDGAHLLTPRVLDLARQCLEEDVRALVAVPDYRFDATRAAWAGDVEGELAWLAQGSWRDDPAALFDVARFGPATVNGFLGPLLGAGCLFARRESFLAVPAPDPAIDLPGGAALSLWLYTELARPRGTRLIVLAGEGAFRQRHPEVDSDEVKRQEADVMHQVLSAALPLGDRYRKVHREPVPFGPIPDAARRFVVESEAVAAYHCAACRARNEPPWYEDS